jgi:hypothetical protein
VLGGIAILDARTMSLEQWVSLAYQALADAKAAGRNCAVALNPQGKPAK